MNSTFSSWSALALCAAIIGCGDDGTGGHGGGADDGGGPTNGGGPSGGGGEGVGGGDGGDGQGGDGGQEPGPCGAVVTWADGLAPTAELHVATNGSDGNDGSAGSPFATIDHAVTVATPGTAIRVHAGTYAGDAYVDGLAGTAAAPIWIGGAPGEDRPVIEGGGEAMHLTRAKYVVVHDLEVRGMSGNGINADDGGDVDDPEASHHLLFDRLYIHDIGSGGNEDCLKLSGINQYVVKDSEMTVCGGGGSGSAIDHVGCHEGLIARNYIHDLTGTGIQCKGGSADIDIRWNRIVGGGERPLNLGGSTGFEFFRPPLGGGENAEALRIRALGNVIVGGTCTAAFVGCVDCELSANTIIDPDQWLFRILQETTDSGGFTFAPARNGVVSSNIFFFARAELSGEDINVGGGTDPGSFDLVNNLWYAHDDPGASAPATPPSAEQGGVVGSDPGFANAGGSDYHIGTSSPAAGAGVEVAGLTGDLDGVCYASPPAIGAYEAQ